MHSNFLNSLFRKNSKFNLKQSFITAPSSHRTYSQSTVKQTEYQSPKYRTLVSKMLNLSEQLNNKTSEYNTLKLYLQNFEQASNKMLMRLTQQNQKLRKQLQTKNFRFENQKSQQLKEMDRAEKKLTKQNEQNRQQQTVFKNKYAKNMNESKEVYNIKNDARQTHTYPCENSFNIFCTPIPNNKNKPKDSNKVESNLKQNINTLGQNCTNFDNNLLIQNLQKEIIQKKADIRLLKQQIQSLTYLFSSQISKLTYELKKCNDLKDQLSFTVENQRVFFQGQLLQNRDSEKYNQNESNSNTHLTNQLNFNQIKNDIIESIRDLNIGLGKQLIQKIQKLLQKDVIQYKSAFTKNIISEQGQRKENKNIDLNLQKHAQNHQPKNKQQNSNSFLNKCDALEVKLLKMLENNSKISKISMKRITTQQAELPFFGSYTGHKTLQSQVYF